MFDFDKLEQEAIKTIQSFVQINSVRNELEAQKGVPFGPGIRAMFEQFVQTSREFGLDTFIDPDGYYAYAEIGPKDKPIIGILGHIDTVGLGDTSQWMCDPVSASIIDGKIIGRGVLDDKGPVAINLIALKALIEQQYEFQHRIRIIVGGAEETTWEGINRYKEQEELPVISYTPDADFPLINGEQGIIQFAINGGGSDFIVCTNNSINAVCDKLAYSGAKANVLIEKINDANYESQDVIISGKSAHAMECYKGDNAINKFVASGVEDTPLLQLLAQFCLDVHGRDLIKINNSENMTLNIGNLNIDNKTSRAEIDMRLPLGCDAQEMISYIKNLVLSRGLQFELLKYQPELYVAEDTPLVSTLMDVYKNIMSKQAQPLTTGGGTYARALDNCVAFGMVFKDENMLDLMHQPNECLEIKFIKPALNIYINAIQALDKLDI